MSTISAETLRRILHERGVSWQATRTWKASMDPDFGGEAGMAVVAWPVLIPAPSN
ncbi:hypothetical protein [Micromonospora tulbaghiae]|uniref:hypothetical protein n=1 Tax=Micromonospora tulbaghiae TaxID=479978 RepID=UPI003EBED40A